MNERRADKSVPAIGEAAPDFELLTDFSQPWRLSGHRGSVAVLLFYPQNETLVCTRQLCSVRDHWERYLETKAVIVGVSPGGPDEHRAFATKHQLPIPLLADPGRQVTRRYLRRRPFPISLLRGIVVIDAEGIIRNIGVMLRAFRPRDEQIITDIYAARGDALSQEYENLKIKARAAHGR